MRYFYIALLIFSSTSFFSDLFASSLNIEASLSYGDEKDEPDLQILGAIDIDVFDPVLSAFSRKNPKISITYSMASTADIYDAVRQENHKYDLIMSSAMDLQMKLVNDGFAKPIDILEEVDVPAWSHWQDKLFGFSLEPIGLVLSASHFKKEDIPITRRSLVSYLRANSENMQKKIVTYDVRTSGAGFLFATQDERKSNSFWRLAEVMGGLNAHLSCCSGIMLDAVNDEKFLLAYNIIGSYAEKRSRFQKNLKVVYFQDYTHLLLRTAFIPKTVTDETKIIEFLGFILNETGQNFIEKETDMISLRSSILKENPHFKPIRLDTGLLVYLDRLKRERFLEEWSSALIQ